MPPRVIAPALPLVVLLACSSPSPPPALPAPAPPAPGPESPLPPIPLATGPLDIRVTYPDTADLVDARDSSFLFGTVGTGLASLTINGAPVRVWPNGAWLAWVALPPDSIMRFDLVAHTPSDTARLTYLARRVPRFVPPDSGAWVDSTALRPAGRVWWPRAEPLPVSVRAAPGATVRILLPDSTVIPLAGDPGYDEVPWGVRAFDRDTTHLIRRPSTDRYAGNLRGRALGPDPGPLLGPLPVCSEKCLRAPDAFPVLEAILGADTARVTWPIRLALLDTVPFPVVLNDDTAGVGDTDSLTVGRAAPGTTYHWFFPTGTRAWATGRINGNLRLQLAHDALAWVAAADAHPLPAVLPRVRATVGSASLTPEADRVVLRLPVSQRIPYRVSAGERSLTLHFYGAAGDVNWIHYGPLDSLVTAMRWDQPAADEVTFTVDLSRPVWGWRARWDRSDLVVEIRRPPAIDPAHPLQDRLIVVDPGHPPLGATGPTGLREAEANLAVAVRLRDLLTAAGARVVMTRTSDVPIGLYQRVKEADSLDADLLVSIHNNALPDGVNPFTNNGTSDYYNHGPSLPLALAVQRALVRRLGLRDLGAGRGDLALVRPTWMPSLLTEGLFMMLPDQEYALRVPRGQQLYAQAVFDGLRTFLLQRAEDRPGR